LIVESIFFNRRDHREGTEKPRGLIINILCVLCASFAPSAVKKLKKARAKFNRRDHREGTEKRRGLIIIAPVI
jgi:hypothetical protein